MLPIFFAYLIFEAIEEFTLYALDVLPWVSGETFWRAFSIGLVLEGLIRFAVIGELFFHLLRPWPALAKVGNRLLSGTGAALVLLATLTAALVRIDNPQYAIISRAHILQQTLYVVQCGLLLLLFVFAAYFRLVWNNRTFGVALGLGIVSCEHLATWAIMASGAFMYSRDLLDLLNMATYHVCVLIWLYCFLGPEKRPRAAVVRLPEHNLEVLNHELERLLQR
ncbi:MAG: hypothetical protein WCA16_16910 [Candidatus Sulfotelmatobacter sp.]